MHAILSLWLLLLCLPSVLPAADLFEINALLAPLASQR